MYVNERILSVRKEHGRVCYPPRRIDIHVKQNDKPQNDWTPVVIGGLSGWLTKRKHVALEARLEQSRIRVKEGEGDIAFINLATVTEPRIRKLMEYLQGEIEMIGFLESA